MEIAFRDGSVAEGCFFFARHDNIVIRYQNFKDFKTKETPKSFVFWERRHNLIIILRI